MLQLVFASLNDIVLIQDLANKIWREYYPAIIGSNQVQYMLNKFYSFESIKQQMTKQNHEFYLIRLNKQNVGFISIQSLGEKKFFIHKFYILQEISNKGIGTKVFKKFIRLFNPKEIRLTVNRKNYRAINFYFKNKFVIEKVEDFDIGNGFYMNDFVMLWRKK